MSSYGSNEDVNRGVGTNTAERSLESDIAMFGLGFEFEKGVDILNKILRLYKGWLRSGVPDANQLITHEHLQYFNKSTQIQR